MLSLNAFILGYISDSKMKNCGFWGKMWTLPLVVPCIYSRYIRVTPSLSVITFIKFCVLKTTFSIRFPLHGDFRLIGVTPKGNPWISRTETPRRGGVQKSSTSNHRHPNVFWGKCAPQLVISTTSIGTHPK